MARLTKQGITLKELIKLSNKAYTMKSVDNKKLRIKQDIIGGKLVKRNHVEYNFSEKQWEQTGRDVKLIFLIRTDPVSYKRPDWDTKQHKYPITLLIHNWDLGMDSTCKLRVGSNYKPKINTDKIRETKDPKKKERIREQNKKYAEYNLRKGIQLQFFFEMEELFHRNGILFGVNYTNRPAKISNPKQLLYLSKHAYFLFVKVMPHLFISPRVNTFIKAN